MHDFPSSLEGKYSSPNPQTRPQDPNPRTVTLAPSCGGTSAIPRQPSTHVALCQGSPRMTAALVCSFPFGGSREPQGRPRNSCLKKRKPDVFTPLVFCFPKDVLWTINLPTMIYSHFQFHSHSLSLSLASYFYNITRNYIVPYLLTIFAFVWKFDSEKMACHSRLRFMRQSRT